MISYKNLLKTFEGRDVEYVKSFYDILCIIGKKVNKKLLHKVKRVLKYIGLRSVKARLRSTEKRSGGGKNGKNKNI